MKDRVYLLHILESIDLVEEYMRGKSKEDLEEDQELQDAIIRRITVIGEAVKNISEELKKANTTIPWTNIAGTRDILVHKYFGVDLNMLWIVINEKLPDLKRKIRSIVQGL